MTFRFKFNYQMLFFVSLLSVINVSTFMSMFGAYQAAEQEQLCSICWLNKGVSQFHANTFCRHNNNCKNCVRYAIESAITDNDLDRFNCSSCGVLLDIADAQAVGLNQQNLDNLQEMLARRNSQNSQEWLNQNTKPCPQCGISIQKNRGCYHMTCRECRHEFWWCCLRLYIPGHQPLEHRQYQGQGDPYASCNGRAIRQENRIIRNVIAGGLMALGGYVFL